MAVRPKPTFPAKSHLCRYIDRDEKHGKRASYGAFMPNPGDDHLSVNSLEVETLQQIAEYYGGALGNEDGNVAVCIHTVLEYSDSGKKAGCWIEFNRAASAWEFSEINGLRAAAYRHRPVHHSEGFPYASWSHCGVEFVRVLADVKLRQFARRLTKRKITAVDATPAAD
jgi:hypothetical protein